jgi:hypothetical protein
LAGVLSWLLLPTATQAFVEFDDGKLFVSIDTKV